MSVRHNSNDAAEQPADRPASGSLLRDLTLYTLARLGLVAVVACLLVLSRVPLLIAVAVALVVGFPLALLLFRRLNARVATGLARHGAAREAERARLRAQLRGESSDDPAGTDQPPS
ncbi:MAG: DUF4229 domain-containing protein [Sciscionella sp.]